MRKSALVTMLLVVATFVAMPAAAQETRGSIEGVVKDTSGGVLPGVTVEAKAVATNTAQTTVTDANGIYRFPSVVPGRYVVSATLSGFNPAKFENLEIQIGLARKVDLTLAIAGLTDTVTVKGEPPVVDVKANSVTAVITKDVIDLLPKGRSLLSAITGVAGTNDDRTGGLMIDGAAAAENRFIVDGMDTTNLRTGQMAKSVVVDFIEQIQVKQSGYNAEFRAATGGVVSAITRSGSNSFHGDVGQYYSGKYLAGLSGNVRPSLRLVPTNNALAEYFSTPRLNESDRFDNIMDIGGPVLKNRAWFFFGYNPVESKTTRTVHWTFPSWTGTPVQTFDSKSTDVGYQYTATYQVAQPLRVRFSGSNNRTTSGLAVPGIDSILRDPAGIPLASTTVNPTLFNPRSPVYTVGMNDSYTGSADWVLDNRTFVSVNGGYFEYGSKSKSLTDYDYYHGVRRVFSTTNVNLLDVPAAFQQPSGYADNLSNSFSEGDYYTRLSLNGDATRYANWRGQHALKAGFQLERFGNSVDTGAQFPTVSLNWGGSYSTTDNRVVKGKYGYYTVSRSYTQGDIVSNNMGMFLQDQWTIDQKLTLNLGLRADRTNIPSYREENPGIVYSFMEKLAPRVGFAYDIKGDGRWKGYGSWGVFYDIEKIEMPRGAWGADRWIDYVWQLDSFNWPAIDCDGTPNSGCLGTFIEQNDRRHVSNEAGHSLVDPDLKPMKNQEFTIGLDHELNRTMSIGIRYAHKWLNTAIEDMGVLVTGIGEVFYMANPGMGKFGTCVLPCEYGYPATPKAKRVYDGVDLTFKRRMANNWMFNANLLVSRTWGNYSGLSGGDEAARSSPNVLRMFDGLYMSFDSKGNPLYGKLQTDRPFQVKMQAGYIMPWGTQMGVNFIAQSGYLNTSSVSYKTVPIYYNGRGDLGRSPTYTQVDLNFTHSFRLPRQMQLNVALNLDNLFDQMIWTTLATASYRETLVLTKVCGVGEPTTGSCDIDFFDGFDIAAAMAARPTQVGRPNATYNKPNGYQGARSARLSVKFTF